MSDFKDLQEYDNSVCIDAGRVYDSCCEQEHTIWKYIQIKKPPTS